MTREEALAQLADIKRYDGWDEEEAHSDADKVLCKLLTQLGYADVVEAWEKINKWYS